jgi:hypothetical protein
MKSFVTLEQHVCPVCGNVHDSGALLLDRRMREKFEMHTVSGYGLCDACKKLKDDGYIALVEVKNMYGSNIKQEDANRTGLIAHVRCSVWKNIFNEEIDPEQFMAFVEEGVIQKLQEMSSHELD